MRPVRNGGEIRAQGESERLSPAFPICTHAGKNPPHLLAFRSKTYLCRRTMALIQIGVKDDVQPFETG